MGRRLASLAAGLQLALACALAQAQHLRFEPPLAAVLEGESIEIRIQGLKPGEQVRLVGERLWAPTSSRRPAPALYRSEAVFVANAQGRVELASQVPLQGSWSEADARAPFWAMRRVEAAVLPALRPHEFRLSLQGVDGRPLDQASIDLLPGHAAVLSEPVPALPGALFAVARSGQRRPALIVVGGSEGGSLINAAAAPLASQGFAVLTLPLYSPPRRDGSREIEALPAGWVELPVELLDRARDWLASRPEVDARRIGLHGSSFGGSLVLLAGAHLPWVAAVVANVPSDVVWDGWGPGVAEGQRSAFSLRGRPLPFVAVQGYEQELARAEQDLSVHIRRAYERGRAARPEAAAAARIPVERMRAPLLVIGAYQDQMWPSGQMAQAVAERRLEAGLPTESLIFQDAGHALYDSGYAPTLQLDSGLRKGGGTPAANARAQAQVWSRTIAFLRRVLGPVPPIP